MRELIAAGVQLPVGHGGVAQGQGHCIGRGRGLAGEPGGKGCGLGGWGRANDVAPGEKLVPHGGIHQIELGDGGVGTGGDVVQKRQIGPEHGLRRPFTQNIRIVFQSQRQIVIPFPHHERDIKLGHPPFEGDGLQGQAAHFHLPS